MAVSALSSMLLAQRRRLFAGLLGLTPPRHRRVVRAVVRERWRRLGSYVGAEVTVTAIVDGATALILWPLGVPSPLLLGIVVALGELVPRIGPWLARLPLFALAALTGWVPPAVADASSLVLQNLEGLVIAPLAEGERLDVHPVVVILAVLASPSSSGSPAPRWRCRSPPAWTCCGRRSSLGKGRGVRVARFRPTCRSGRNRALERRCPSARLRCQRFTVPSSSIA